MFLFLGGRLQSVGNADKPVYLCSITEDFDEEGITISNCELLIDSGNTACDLVLTYRDAKKFNLKVTKQMKKICQAEVFVVVAKMIPELKVTFALADDHGIVTEKSAYLDVWVKLKDIPECALPKSFRDRLAAERAADADRDRFKGTALVPDSLENAAVAVAQVTTGEDVQPRDTTDVTAPTTPLGASLVPINKPSPVKHTAHGSANLGKSGAKKLKLKYDFDLNEISFMEDSRDFPEL